jgi:hypothetical protein
MTVSNGNGHRSDSDPAALDLEWRDEQLQRVRAVFDAVDVQAADADLRAAVLEQLPARSTDLVAGIGVFRDLLRVEHRPDRFRRLLRIWSGKVGSGVRSGEFEIAGLWMRALGEAPVFAEEFASLVAEARKELSRPDLFDTLVKGLVEAGTPGSAAPLLAAWGEPFVEYLVGHMVGDTPIVNRRHIVEFLGMAGRGDVRLLTAHLSDPRWFIVRNIATAVGRTGRVTAIPALEYSMSHTDERVRVEVLRAIAALKGDDSVQPVIAAMSDPSPKVRGAAVSILRACPAPSVVPGIVEALEHGIGSAEDARRLVQVIAERRGDAVFEALEHLAGGRKFSFGASKAVRDAAREALKGWSA